MRRVALLALLPALALTACGGDDPSPTASAPPSTTPATSAPGTSAPGTSASPTADGGPGCPAQTAPDPTATVVTADVIGKKVQPPNQTVTVKVGSKVRVAITTDVADEVHVQTYDLRENVAAGCTSAIDFVANIPGTVEVELEKAHVHVVEIKATP